jgi:transketolase
MSIAKQCANTIRGLAMDAVQRANSGHPGMPMGMADIATVLWTQFLRYDPDHPDWPDRDRMVISNGHGSMLLYSMLHMSGTSLTLDDLKDFRQWGSPTAGHPEYGEAPGIETTTGPLGQGLANGVGMALAERWLNAKFGDELVDHRTYVLCGDGCLMEGISHESASLAGHLGLGKLVVLYDDNCITIDGATDISFSENVGGRFKAYGWHVQHCDGHDQAAIAAAVTAANLVTDKPSIICCRTVIGWGSPKLAGTSKSHGAPLGADEIRSTKVALGLDPEVDFAVPQAVVDWVRSRDAERTAAREAWETRLSASPDAACWARFQSPVNVDDIALETFEPGQLATRKASHKVLQQISNALGNLIGGSADLAGSNGSTLSAFDAISKDAFGGRNIHFGVREHAMGAICNGMSLHSGVVPFCATFMIFHDYMRPAVRLAGLMKQQVVYVYTHDSIHVGEDGPTHQPIEQLQSMRAMINMWVVRPADANETIEAWRIALNRTDGPTALCLTRQNLETLDRSQGYGAVSGVSKGAYVLAEARNAAPSVVLIATGSEVGLALAAQIELENQGVPARVVSMPCVELFDEQDAAYQREVLPTDVPRVVIEAGVTFGWHRIAGSSGAVVGIDRFGASAPGALVAEKLGMNVDNVMQTALRTLGRG